MSEREDLVLAYRILAAHGVVDAYGHVSLRTAKDPNRYLLARAMAPELVTADDILEFDLDSSPVKDVKAALYLERYIHGEIFKCRPDINAVVHNHSPSVIPFGVTTVPLRPLFNTGAFIGEGVPTFEIRDFQDSGDLIIKTPHLGHALATTLGARPEPDAGGGAQRLSRTLRQAADAGDADRRTRRPCGVSRRARSGGHQWPSGFRRHLETHVGPVVHQGAGANRNGAESKAAEITLPWRGRVGSPKAIRGGVTPVRHSPSGVCCAAVTPPRSLRERPSPFRGG